MRGGISVRSNKRRSGSAVFALTGSRLLVLIITQPAICFYKLITLTKTKASLGRWIFHDIQFFFLCVCVCVLGIHAHILCTVYVSVWGMVGILGMLPYFCCVFSNDRYTLFYPSSYCFVGSREEGKCILYKLQENRKHERIIENIKL